MRGPATALALFALLLPTAAPSAQKPANSPERRCGWVFNPTPGNWWLQDADRMWMIAVQNRYQAKGMDKMPDMSIQGWVETNGHYGYGCGCMTVTTDRKESRILTIIRATPLPLKTCQADRKLPKP